MRQSEHAGWRSRGYLPHLDSAGLAQHIVFGLSDALPRSAPLASFKSAEEKRAWFDAAMDRGEGEALLGGDAADIMEGVLRHEDGEAYALLAWCVMPNHVHVLIEQFEGYRLADIVQSWKSVSARRINAQLGRRGALWRREYFDRFMRDDDQYNTTVAYIENNPVAAGLALRPADWKWSSARLR